MFKLSLKGGKSVYEQVYEQIAGMITGGILRAGEQLPTIRTVAKDLGVNPNTVQNSYQLLEANNLTFSVTGKGCFVAEGDTGKDTLLRTALENFGGAADKALRHGANADTLHEKVDEAAENYKIYKMGVNK